MIRKEISLLLNGILIILAGIFMLFLQNASLEWIKYIVAGIMFPAALFALFTAINRNKQSTQFAYHEMHALAFFAYAIAVMFFSPSLDDFIFYTATLFVFYTFSEITFAVWLFNLKKDVNPRVMIARLAIGLLVGIGPVILLAHSASSKEVKLMAIGFFLIIIGINVLLYKPVMKAFQVPDFPNQANLQP